jgi:hypothetical protein
MALVRAKPTRAETVSPRERVDLPNKLQTPRRGVQTNMYFVLLAFGWWLYARNHDLPVRRASDHVLLSTLVASALPHVPKRIFDQERA